MRTFYYLQLEIPDASYAVLNDMCSGNVIYLDSIEGGEDAIVEISIARVSRGDMYAL